MLNVTKFATPLELKSMKVSFSTSKLPLFLPIHFLIALMTFNYLWFSCNQICSSSPKGADYNFYASLKWILHFPFTFLSLLYYSNNCKMISSLTFSVDRNQRHVNGVWFSLGSLTTLLLPQYLKSLLRQLPSTISTNFLSIEKEYLIIVLLTEQLIQ